MVKDEKIKFNNETFILKNHIKGCNQEVAIYENENKDTVFSIEYHENVNETLYHLTYTNKNISIMKHKDKVYINTYNETKTKRYMSLQGETIRLNHHPFDFAMTYIQTQKQRAINNAWTVNGEVVKIPNCWETT